jgi:hypothetical protein
MVISTSVEGRGTGVKVMLWSCHAGTVPVGSPESSLGVDASRVTWLNTTPGSAITPRKRLPPAG